MAKRDEYPQSRHLTARIQAVAAAVVKARGFASLLRKHVLPGVEPRIKEHVEQDLQELEAALDLATQALSGNDEE